MPTKEDFEYCRTVRHPWEILDVAELADDPLLGYVRELRLRCTSCTGKRYDQLDSAGDLVYRRYEYPDGYLHTGEDERPTLQELRLRLLSRTLKPAPPVPALKETG